MDKDCSDFAELVGWEKPTPGYLPKQCCDSCHDDRQDGYEMLEPPDGSPGEVCCAVAKAWKATHSD